MKPISSIISHFSRNPEPEDTGSHTGGVSESTEVSLGEVADELSEEQKFFVLKRLNYGGLLSTKGLPQGAAFMLEKVQDIPEADAVEILKAFLKDHEDDPNILGLDYDHIQTLVQSEPTTIETTRQAPEIEEKKDFAAGIHVKEFGKASSEYSPSYQPVDWALEVKLEAALIAYHSPYSEVRSVTEPFDDPTVPVETLRVYVLGIFWVVVGTVVNQLFSERLPSISIGSAVVQLLLYFCGKFVAYVTPKWSFSVFGHRVDLNPGPWNIKEQMLATMFFSVAGGAPYVSYNIHVQKVHRFYGSKWATFGYQVLLMLSNNFLGFGLAGIMRKIAVYPVASVWQYLLPTLALNKALLLPEKKESINGWTISRYWWFFSVFTCSFLYFWLPDYLFEALSTFNWLTWIKPDNFALVAITGTQKGLGFNPIPTFDWNMIGSGSLSVPFYSTVMQYGGAFLGFFIIVGVYWTNYKWTAFLPINSNSLFDNTGKFYSVRAVVDENNLFDQKKYEKVGPPFYSAANLVVYGAFFAIYPFGVLYELYVNWGSISSAVIELFKSLKSFKRSTYEGFEDPHSRMMAKYKEVPEWVFTIVLLISIVLAILCVKLYPAETPVWAIFFAVGINFLFLIPITVLYSRTGFSFSLNVLVELIAGYILPGNGLALNFIKAYGTNTDLQAQNYITDQKMGHYVKLPPRAMFRAQIISVFIASFVSLAIMNFEIGHIKDYCMPNQEQKFTCPNSTTFFSASVIWGVIGPRRIFNGLYPVLKYCFLIGFLLVFPCIAFKRYGPKKWTRYFQPTLIIGGMISYAPTNLAYLTGGLYMSAAFMWYVRSRYPAWWEKYNYILAGALEAGIAVSGIIIFFAVQYHDKAIDWWGNNVPYQGIEGGYGQQSLLNATLSAPDGYFGPRVGHFP